MNWENIKRKHCPNCNCKLLFRLGGSTYKIKANLNFAKQKETNENWYFCSRCPKGFQISEKKMHELLKEQKESDKKHFKNNPVFKSGYLSF